MTHNKQQEMWNILSIFLLLLLISDVAANTLDKKVGENASIVCPEVKPGQKFQNVTWYKDKAQLAFIDSARTPPLMSDSRISFTTDGFFRMDISNLIKQDAGVYDCQLYVSDDSEVQTLETKQTTLTVVAIKPVTKVYAQSRQATVSWSISNENPIQHFYLSFGTCDSADGASEKKVPASQSEATFESLQPNTCYKLAVQAEYSSGRSERSVEEFKTLEEAKLDDNTPSAPPSNLKYDNLSSTEIKLNWQPPPKDQLNGDLEGYIIKYGTNPANMTTLEVPAQQNAHTITGLRPYTMYDVKISAKNKAGSGPELAESILTNEGIPGVPRVTHITKRKATSFVVHWQPPTEINGVLVSYELQWINVHTSETKTRTIKGHIMIPMIACIQDLIPYTDYAVHVAAATNAGQGNFSNTLPALTEVAAPSPPRNLNITKLSSNSVHLSWDPPLHYNKSIDKYIIRGWGHSQSINEEVSGHQTEVTLFNLAYNSKYYLKVAAITNCYFDPSSHEISDFTNVVDVLLGAAGNNVIRDRISRNDEKDQMAAGLHPGIIFAIVFGILIICGVVALVVGYRFYNCRRLFHAAYYYLTVPSNSQPTPTTIVQVEEPSEEKHYSDVSVVDFISHVEQMHMDSDIGFSQEFDEINRITHSDKYKCENSNLNDNKSKNRYINIVAYDHSRVSLKSELRMRQSDYINANYVDGYKKSNAYIATQGPLPQTFPDFWRMVWEQNTSVIVMITNLMEKGRRKCDQYWPNDGSETYGNMQVKLITTVPRAHYTVRVFTLRNIKRHSMKGNPERTVYHYHYTEWPDHGVPDYSLPVLTFVQKSASQSGPEHGPIIVHCSAGVGRTGTYILIDSMIAQIEDKKSINIPGFTQHIRRQRNFLVQTEDQYIFIHELLKEYLLSNGSTEVREEDMCDHLVKLEQPAKCLILPSFTDSTLLERQFQLITEYIPNELDLSAALKPINLEKNREGGIIPVNLKRVLLPARPGVEGSDYINATYLQGYKKSAEFIVTQHPTEDTMEDFWRMVWDKNSPVIVVLSPFDEEEYKEFWPPKGSSIEVDSGNFRLTLKDGPILCEEKGYVTSEYILDSIQYDYTLLTRIICVNNWPYSLRELHTTFDVIIAADSYLNSLECGPIIVMDRFGAVEAGTFCALWTLRDQLLSEKCADIYQVCKLYHYKRPGIIGTQNNFLFLHQALAAYCKHLQDEGVPNGSSPRHHHHHLSFHHGSTRRNGTLPRSNPSNTNNVPNSVHSSNTLPRSSTHMGTSNTNSDESSSLIAPSTESAKLETNI
ncbi:tyrosine-protein phosphatase 99A-like isoform X2 [Physella acuta]|uniref:tyrosine-protein phosphatase 99A-like isoform X2 n=1 Tax=Physella acuta TaxID=109671 RepID=UPI0027DAC2FC|nr:tyrosine-protein phosphatase 99A-like isoform X2 [Physella acuta]